MDIASNNSIEGLFHDKRLGNLSPLLSTKEAGKYLGLSTSTLNKWRCFGTGPRFVKLGRAVRYRKAELDEYLKEHSARNTIY